MGLLVLLAGTAGTGCQGARPVTAVPVVTISALAVDGSVAGGNPIEFLLRAKTAPRADLTVSVTSASTGCGPAQFPESVTISAGDSEATLTVHTNGVSVGPDGCTVTALIAPGDGYRVDDAGQSASTRLSAAKDTGALLKPVITITASGSVVEGEQVSFTLTSTPAPTSPLTVGVTWSDTGSFLTKPLPTTVTIRTSRTATLAADTDDDSTGESDGTVTVTVQAGNGYTVGTQSSANVSVGDNDSATRTPGSQPGGSPAESLPTVTPAVTISADTDSVVEGSRVSFTLTSTPPPTSPLAVNVTWSATGSVLTGLPQTVTIPTTGTAALVADTDDDSTEESDGTVTVTVQAGNGYTVGMQSSASVSVTDNDASVQISIAAVSNALVEGEQVSFTLTSTPPPTSPLAVNVSWSLEEVRDRSQRDPFPFSWLLGAALLTGTQPQTVTIRADAAAATFSAGTNDNLRDNGVRSVTVTVQPGSGYTITTAAASVSVADNDPQSYWYYYGGWPNFGDPNDPPTDGVVRRIFLYNGGYVPRDKIYLGVNRGTSASCDMVIDPTPNPTTYSAPAGAVRIKWITYPDFQTYDAPVTVPFDASYNLIEFPCCTSQLMVLDIKVICS